MLVFVAGPDPLSARVIAESIDKGQDELRPLPEGGEAISALSHARGPLVCVIKWPLTQPSPRELCRALELSHPRHQRWVIGLLGSAADRRAIEALGDGADDVVVHPLTASEMAARLAIARRFLSARSAPAWALSASSPELEARLALARQAQAIPGAVAVSVVHEESGAVLAHLGEEQNREVAPAHSEALRALGPSGDEVVGSTSDRFVIARRVRALPGAVLCVTFDQSLIVVGLARLKVAKVTDGS